MTTFSVSGNISKAGKTRMATLPNGQKTMVTDFNIAVNDGNGDNAIVTFYKVTLWGQRGANLCPYLSSGKEVDVKGIPGQEKPWTGEDGIVRAGMMTIRRAEVVLRGKKILAEDEPADDEAGFPE